jgi:hypothetical protein
VSFAPDDHADLVRYTDMYAETYGEPAAPADLVPFIVRAFLAEDREFKRVKKGADVPVKAGKRGAP